MTTIDRMRKVLDAVFEGEIDSASVSIDADLKADLDMNSISMLYMVMGLEEEFSVKFENTDFAGLKTVSDVVRCIEEKL